MDPITQFIEDYQWDSDVQKKGFLNLVQYLDMNDHNSVDQPFTISSAALAAYFIQRDHESQEWWSETVGSQVTRLQDEIADLRRELTELHSKRS